MYHDAPSPTAKADASVFHKNFFDPDLIDSEDVAAIREFIRLDRQIDANINASTQDAARAEWHRLRDEFTSDCTKPGAFEFFRDARESRREINDRFSETAKALKIARRALRIKYLPVFKRILEAAKAPLVEFVKDREEGAREMAEEYGVPYQHDTVTAGFLATIALIDKRLDANENAPLDAQVFTGIIDLEDYE